MTSILQFLAIICLWTLHANAFLDYEKIDCENRTKPTTAYKQHFMLFFDDQTCCDKEKYRLGTTSDLAKYFDECNIEPQNKTMSLTDSMWTFLECVLKKGLGPKELSQTNFVERMTQNLTSSKRSAIFDVIKGLKTAPLKLNGSVQLQSIKTYWSQYFDAEYQVCTKSSLYTNDTVKARIQKDWEPSQQCYDGKIPDYYEFAISYTDIINCSKSVDATYSLMLNRTQEYIPFAACFYILNGHITQQDLSNVNLKYDDLVAKAIPKYFSSSVKKQLEHLFWEIIKVDYSDKTKGGSSIEVHQLFEKMKESKRKQLGKETDAGKINVYLNMKVMDNIMGTLFAGIGQICQGPEKQMGGKLDP